MTDPSIATDPTTCQLHRSDAECAFLTNIVAIAVEGGIGYWSWCSDYRWYSPTLSGGSALHQDDKCNAYATIREIEEPAEVDGAIHLDLDVVAKGLARLLHPGFAVRSDIAAAALEARETRDAGLIDAEIADCIVQAGLFGKLVYG